MNDEDIYNQAMQSISAPKRDTSTKVDQGIRGFLETIGNSSIGKIGEFVLDTGASMISEPYKKNLINQQRLELEEGLRQRGALYSNKLYGKQASVSPYDSLTQELFREDNPNMAMPLNELAGTGLAGGKMDISNFLRQQQSNPNTSISQAANLMIQDRFKPTSMQTFVGGVTGQPNMRQLYKPDGDGNLVKTNTPAYGIRDNGVSVHNEAARNESTYQKTMGKANAERFMAIQQSAITATSSARQYTDLAKLSKGMYTGTLGNQVQAIRKFAASIGVELPEFIDGQSLGSARGEYMKAITNKMAMALRGDKDAGLTGSTSDRDLQFLIESIPGITNTPEGIAYMAEAMENHAQLKREIADYAASQGQYNASVRRRIAEKFKDRSILPERTAPWAKAGGAEASNPTTESESVDYNSMSDEQIEQMYNERNNQGN